MWYFPHEILSSYLNSSRFNCLLHLKERFVLPFNIHNSQRSVSPPGFNQRLDKLASSLHLEKSRSDRTDCVEEFRGRFYCKLSEYM